MGGLRRQKALEDRGPTGGDVVGAVGSGLGLVGSLIPGEAGQLVSGLGSVAGLGSQGAAEQPDVLGALGAVASVANSVSDLAELGDAGTIFGGIGNGLGIVSGIRGAFDENRSGADRVVSGVDAAGNGLSLGATVASGGEFSLTAAGSGLGGASTLLGTGVGEIAAAGGATAAGAAGAVLGAGVAGYGVGTVINDAGTSDSARLSVFGEDMFTGQDRTAVEAWTDLCAEQATNRENDAWREARGIEQAGASANEWIDNVTGTDAVGDVVQGAADLYAGAHEWGGSVGAHLAGGTAAAVGAIPAAFFGAGVSLGRWSEEAMGPENARSVRGAVRGAGSAVMDGVSGAASAISSWFD